MLVSTVTGSEGVLSSGTHVVLEVVRIAVNVQFPTLMPTLYPGSKATDPRPHASLDVMWKAFSDLMHNKTPAVSGENIFIYLFLRRERGHPPRRGPSPPFMGAARAECRPSRLLGRRVRAIIRLSCRLLNPPIPGSIKCPTAGPYKNNTIQKVSLLVSRLRPTTLLLSEVASSRPSTTQRLSEKTGVIALTVTKTLTPHATAGIPLSTPAAV